MYAAYVYEPNWVYKLYVHKKDGNLYYTCTGTRM